MTKSAETPRLWAGTTLEERRHDRRAKLLDAGITLIAAGGGQAASVRAVCREAGLTSRYFYEHFRDREEFTVALYEELAEELEAAVRDAVDRSSGKPAAVAAAAVDAVVGLTIDQPEKGRVMWVASMTDDSLLELRDRHFTIVGDMIADQISMNDPPEVRRLKAASLVGALSHVFLLYASGRMTPPRDVFVRHCVDLLVTVAGMQGRR